MPRVSYQGAPVPVREEIRAAHERFFERLRAPGTWLTGAERLFVAAAARAADACEYCRDRKAALSPSAMAGRHADAAGPLAGALPGSPLGTVEVVHRIRTDPGRLSRRFYDEAMASGLSDAQYVEIAGLVAQLTGVDSFCRAIGVPLHPLPEPVPGSPTRRRPAGAKPGAAWVPWVEPADAVGTEADLYPRVPRIPNVAKALSLVPAEVHGMADLSAAHYMQMQQVIDVRVHRTLSRAQMELIAGRVSALNQCFY